MADPFKVKFVVRAQTDQGEMVFAVDWERQMISDFANGLIKAAMMFGNAVLVMDMSKAGLNLSVQHTAPAEVPSKMTLQ